MFNRISSLAITIDADGLQHVTVAGQQVYPLVDTQGASVETFGAPVTTALGKDSPASAAFAAAVVLAAQEIAAGGTSRVRVAGSVTEYAPPTP